MAHLAREKGGVLCYALVHAPVPAHHGQEEERENCKGENPATPSLCNALSEFLHLWEHFRVQAFLDGLCDAVDFAADAALQGSLYLLLHLLTQLALELPDSSSVLLLRLGKLFKGAFYRVLQCGQPGGGKKGRGGGGCVGGVKVRE